MEKTGSKHINRRSSISGRTAEELVILAKDGNALAFTALWDKHIEQLRLFLRMNMKILNNIDIDDVCSRSFEKAFRQIRSYDPSISKFNTWLKIIARNTALDLKAQEERFHPRLHTIYIDADSNNSTGIESIPDQVPSPIDTIIKNENEEENQANINKLPETYREVTRKRIIEGMQYKEIAEETGLNINTVKTRISRAKEMLNKLHKENEQKDI
ncbi:MAG: RNA polymerase sigma factor [Bacteroidales bacterium]|jgi:RNA polymerase sigma-70 factor (ECF subfamily)|nr:RNA polymerase sigma factor [Bacteroidales bacterium]